jgi:lipopolysaccharide transport system permease protein
MRYTASPFAMFDGLLHHRSLVWQLTKREVLGRYRGSLMGLAWSWFHPLLMLGVYTFVFSVIFSARWAGTESQGVGMAPILFTGMLMHGLFAECANRAPTLILSNPNLVKKVVFPLDVLQWVVMGSALFHAAAGLAVLLAVSFLQSSAVPWTALLIPLVLLPLVLLTMGVGWFLAATGVFLRDLGQAMGLVTSVLLFLSPVFYPVSAIPEHYRPLLRLNPLTFIIEQARDVLIWGTPPDWFELALYTVAGFFVASVGFWWFQRARRGFADVL